MTFLIHLLFFFFLFKVFSRKQEKLKIDFSLKECSMPKVRADQLLVDQAFASSKEQAKRLIMAGKVAFIPHGKEEDKKENLILITKPGHPYPDDIKLVLTGQERFVSRGAYKLLTALEYFNLNVENTVCLDAGASTGGFTDCLLQHNAQKVYAVDVGTLQLHEKLRADPRVISMENTNLRHATKELIPEEIDFLVVDVSFISLTLILPPCMQWLKKDAKILALIKPQFEVASNQTKKGVVREEAYRQEAIDKVLNFCEHNLPLDFHGIVPSAIKGPKGNQEYLAYWSVHE